MELISINPNDAHQAEFDDIQGSFYALMARINNMLQATVSIGDNASMASDGTRSGSTATIIKIMKLPDLQLPTFDGKFEQWMSFKNAFRNLVDSRPELSNIDKLHYLCTALTGEASNKVSIFSVDGVNYNKAWEVLKRAYEVKRLIVSRNISLLLNPPVLDKETAVGLMKLADDEQQHVAALASLGVMISPHTVVNVLESKLPKSVADRWENKLARDQLPLPEQIYEFLYKEAVCVSKRERKRASDSGRAESEQPKKRGRTRSSNRALVMNTSTTYPACGIKRHPLFTCEKFKELAAPKRIEVVKAARLCYNCMRSHRDKPCGYSSCSICKKRHNTLLHLDQRVNTNRKDTSEAHSEPGPSAPPLPGMTSVGKRPRYDELDDDHAGRYASTINQRLDSRSGSIEGNHSMPRITRHGRNREFRNEEYRASLGFRCVQAIDVYQYHR